MKYIILTILIVFGLGFTHRTIAIQNPSPTYPMIRADVTMYSSVESCSHDCIMASGKQAYDGAAACPRSWPLGTKIEILGHEFTCEDRTNLKYDGRIDIWAGYGSIAHETAIHWGIKNLDVTIK